MAITTVSIDGVEYFTSRGSYSSTTALPLRWKKVQTFGFDVIVENERQEQTLLSFAKSRGMNVQLPNGQTKFLVVSGQVTIPEPKRPVVVHIDCIEV